jgi:hypothetical protein
MCLLVWTQATTQHSLSGALAANWYVLQALGSITAISIAIQLLNMLQVAL